ncbi:MAG TPA: hypothetical protein VFZ61_03710 [Polyangiales bacterium]
MSETYVRKQEVVEVEVITQELYDRLQAQDPGFVKHASIGDYLVSRGLGTPARIVTPGQLQEEYEKPDAVQGAASAGKVEAIAEALEKAFEQIEALEAKVTRMGEHFDPQVHDLDRRTINMAGAIAELEQWRAVMNTPVQPPPQPYAIAPEATKPETPRAKGKQ